MTTEYGKGDTEWFVRDRFGMFIHWGLYSMAARHEWVKHNEKISDNDYQNYFDLFDPDLFNPQEWARSARQAGMKYVVITTKHHEGFCLWDSKYTDYKATNTPCGKDLLREIVEAFRSEGLRVGFYYSLIDWHHPDFTVDRLHPDRDRPEVRATNKERSMKRYAEYMRNQVEELLTEFGKIDILWFDFSYPGEDGKSGEDWESEKMIRMIRRRQPGIIVNNRLDLPGVGDVTTPEQYVPAAPVRDADGHLTIWEGCQTFSGSWGYHRDENTWKTPEMMVQMLVNHVCRDGNLLLNVGPTARGLFDERAKAALEAMGRWMTCHSKSIYNCKPAPEWVGEAPPDCRFTYNPDTNRLYLHIFAWQFKYIHLAGLAGKVKYAQLLNDASEVVIRAADKYICNGLDNADREKAITLELPIRKNDTVVPVVELILN